MKYGITSLVFLLGGLCFSADDSVEPSRTFYLEMAGAKHKLLLNQAVKIAGTHTNPTVILKASPIRTFPYGGISFNYPAHFSWEADLSGPQEKLWTLSGNSTTLMMFILPTTPTVDEYAQAMAHQFGVDTALIRDITRKLGAKTYGGKRLMVSMAGAFLAMEIFTLPAKTGSRIMVFQDTTLDGKALSPEAKEVFNILAASFKDTASAD